MCISGLLPYLEQAAVFCANDNCHSEPVGSKEANPWGLRDIHGNVMEWCWDWSDFDYPTGSVADYEGPSGGSGRGGRGGDWGRSAGDCRSAVRYSYSPGIRSNTLGFRLLRSLPEE